jgi:hypothetical protein
MPDARLRYLGGYRLFQAGPPYLGRVEVLMSSSMYVKSTAVALQAIFIISIAPLADSGKYFRLIHGLCLHAM